MRCAQIRVKRQARFHMERMARAKGARVASEKKELEQDITLIRAPAALARDREAAAKAQQKLRVPVEQNAPEADHMED